LIDKEVKLFIITQKTFARVLINWTKPNLRGIKKLGIDTLRVVSPKVTTEPELTGSSGNRKNISSTLVNESGNPNKIKFVQLELFDIKEWKTG